MKTRILALLQSLVLIVLQGCHSRPSPKPLIWAQLPNVMAHGPLGESPIETSEVVTPILKRTIDDLSKGRDTLVLNSARGTDEGERSFFENVIDTALSDIRNYYGWRTLGGLAIALIPAALLANTQGDEDLQDRLGQTGSQRGLDRFSDQVKKLGAHLTTLPIYAALTLMGNVWSEWETGSTVSRWAGRSLRGIFVGAPTVFILQRTLGSTRPNDPDPHSHWRPFQDSNGASGHAFVGAVPFLAAASMAESWYLRYPLVAASFLPGWSRIHQDDHFVSQVILGWSVALLATSAIDQTDSGREILVYPFIADGRTGVSVAIPF